MRDAPLFLTMKRRSKKSSANFIDYSLKRIQP